MTQRDPVAKMRNGDPESMPYPPRHTESLRKPHIDTSWICMQHMACTAIEIERVDRN